MVNIFRVEGDCNHYLSFLDCRLDLFSNIYHDMMAGCSIINKWTPGDVQVVPGRLGDFTSGPTTFAKLCATQHAIERIGDDLSKFVELLPFQYATTSYWAIYLPRTSDCLDVEKSEFFGNNRNMSAVFKTMFIEDKIPEDLLFRLPGSFYIYCTDVFFELVQKHQLTGLKFYRVWSDGMPVRDDGITLNRHLSQNSKVIKKRGRETKRDKLLKRLWSDVIDSAAGVDHLDRFLQMPPPPDNSVDLIADASRVLQVAVAKGVEENALRQMIRSLAYHIVFDTLIALEEEGADTTPALRSLHEDLLMAQRT